MEEYRIGKLNVTFDILEMFLKLKKDHKIVGVLSNSEDNINRKFNIIVKGPNMPEFIQGQNVTPVMIDRVMDTILVQDDKLIEE